MLNKQIVEDLSNKIRDIYKSAPTADFEKNFHALLQGAFTKLELVSREEFDIQADLLRVAREKLQSLEVRVAELEALLQKNNK
jgi:ubiquinone biosynthesis accessory factor UbiK